MFSFFRRDKPSFTGAPPANGTPGKPFALPRGAHLPWQAERWNELDILPRALVHVFPKQPFADWARKQGTDQDLAALRHTDSLAYLIPTVTWETAESEEFIEHHWQHFFAQALEGWDQSEKHWPQRRTFEMFNQWFEVRTAEMVLDLGGYEQ